MKFNSASCGEMASHSHQPVYDFPISRWVVRISPLLTDWLVPANHCINGGSENETLRWLRSITGVKSVKSQAIEPSLRQTPVVLLLLSRGRQGRQMVSNDANTDQNRSGFLSLVRFVAQFPASGYIPDMNATPFLCIYWGSVDQEDPFYMPKSM